ncbi:MAG TPA: hypothetical protein VL651_07100 [Bacteroidia bacterium]|jgi:hypothetical protein|nr:hypothetical protein [Bacteroidia bacterium]
MKQHYIRTVLLVFLAFTGRTVSAQFGLPTGFDVKTFQKNEDQAMWFLQYDSAYQAVATFDHLGSDKDFICIPDKKNWKVVVGTLDAETGFKAGAAYYIVDAKKAVTVSDKKKFDTLTVAAMGRALYSSNQSVTKANISAPGGWRKFTKVNDDKSITVWEFCDTDASGNIWYGPECAYYYSADGKNLSTSKVVNKTPLMAGKSGTTLNLSCPTDKMPTIGAMWVARRFMLQYPEVNIAYKTGTSTLRYNTTEKTYAWEHAAN